MDCVHTIPVDAVARQVESNRAAGASRAGYSEAMRLYNDYLAAKITSDDEANIAFAIHDDSTQREILEALILSNCPDATITEAFDVPQRSIELYRELFFDIAKFQTRLAIISYLENYQGDATGFGRQLKMRAVNLGYEYVLYEYANMVPKTKQQKALVERMFMTSAYKAMNANFCGLTSMTGKQALEHGKLMLKAYDTLVKLGNDDTDNNYDLTRILVNNTDVAQYECPCNGEIV